MPEIMIIVLFLAGFVYRSKLSRVKIEFRSEAGKLTSKITSPNRLTS